MLCPQQESLTNTEYLRALNRRVAQERVPISGTFEITRRCNLKCIHCYLGTERKRAGAEQDELSTEEIFSILDQVVDAGCLFFLITGGEPLLRKDFPRVYRYAREKGLLVTVFSNGTLIDKDTISLFRELPPLSVEISVYGATRETYEGITGVEGSFDRCLAGIEGLVEAGVKVKLKTILMKANLSEFFAIEDLAKRFGVKFRFDGQICSRFDGDDTVLAQRVAPETVVELEFAGADRRRRWQEYFARDGHKTIPPGVLFDCGAGTISFNVTPYGYLQPCLMTTYVQYDLREGDFRSGWESTMKGLRDRPLTVDSGCGGCNRRVLCGYCPPFFRLESGEESTASEYCCKIAKERFDTLSRMTVGV